MTLALAMVMSGPFAVAKGAAAPEAERTQYFLKAGLANFAREQFYAAKPLLEKALTFIVVSACNTAPSAASLTLTERTRQRTT